MDKKILKDLVCKQIDLHAEAVIECVKSIGQEAELGFKEHKTAAKVAQFFDSLNIPHRDGLAITGVRGELGSGKRNVAVLGEMDAVICQGHPQMNTANCAAHACGHNIQIGAMLAVASAFADRKVVEHLDGKITFFAVPAEEYVEIAYRNELREQGKLRYLGGKQELIALGEFDDIDMSMMIHSQKNTTENRIYIGKSSNGFIGKTIHYTGKTSHAAESPELGVNALNAAMLGLMGIHAMRETFRDEDAIRVHPIITKGGDLVNSVPADVRIETYVRAKTMKAIDDTHGKVDQALRGGAMAIGADVTIETTPGYLPLVSSLPMNELFIENIKTVDSNVVIDNIEHFGASLDVGDVSHIMPVIHPFTGGVNGALHSKEFKIEDYHIAVIAPAKAMAMTVIDLLYDKAQTAEQILAEFKPVFTKEEYLAKLDSYFSKI